MDQYMPLPPPYFIRNASELEALRADVTKADEAAATETDPIQKMRAEQHARSLRRQLEDAERQALLDTKRRAPVPPPRPNAMPPRPTVNAAEPQYAAVVPYFDEPGHVPVGNAAAKWPPLTFLEHRDLLNRAVAEVKAKKLLEKPTGSR